ncbi:MAG: hypothetical protein FWG79_03695 [Bacteroidales bacterium]|nr:hypothetical protein [Bacteroidales bacterium]
MKYKDTKKISLIAIWLFLAFFGQSQRSNSRIPEPTFDFAKAEMELALLFDTLARGDNHHIRYNANERFLNLLKNILTENGAFDYPFAQLQVEKLMPPDKKFRLFNWMVRRDQGIEYFAVMMVYHERTKNYQIIQLIDESDIIFDLPNALLDKDNWYGAYYRQVIQTEHNGRKFYTLLGQNDNDRTLNRRLVEILTFKPNGDLVFGAEIFVGLRGRKERFRRHVFEFKRGSSMILRYDFQTYSEPIGTPRPGQKQREKLIKSNMIVFDRLVPQSSDLASQREAYIAAGGVYDAYVWLNGRWTLKTDILARNPEPQRRRGR